ncbi:MAG: TonB-dependent receptor [Firmicutes bacterium]|nr:TonB-dependent receptor [Bacillota bacterium]MCM1401246.1 TonB-dependent receptor [Bacteroides sp.]
MKRSVLSAICLVFALCAFPQLKSKNLGGVVVTARRPMKEIGVQKTTFDSVQLKENVALSMADVLAFNSGVFVKSYGRATLSTVAFRGTSPSHTQVTWNGMRINNPMLGMTDFSTIPAYFIDRASLLHGSSSVNESGGGIGGLVKLGTAPDVDPGIGVKYIQGIGSFKTFDEFGRFTYGTDHWSVSTRAVYSSSPNDYKYTNRDKKLNIYDDDHNIIGQYFPTERNRSGAFKDLQLLQEVYYNSLKGDRVGLAAWFINSNRELPMLTTDYGSETEFENRQRERTFRGVVSWNHHKSSWSTGLRGGYVNTFMAYDYRRETAPGGPMAVMTRSRSRVNTIYGQIEGDYTPSRQWYFTANAALYQHFVKSTDRKIVTADNETGIVGYDKGRVEFSGSVSAKWQPIDRMGVSAVLREEMFGDRWASIIPAFFIDGRLTSNDLLTAKASITRNHRFPSLNDLYFMPGGNPDLESETGFTYDAGIALTTGKPNLISFSGSLTWFDSRIDNWIIWLPTTKGFFSPRNVKKVHAYGIELKASVGMKLWENWLFDFNGSYSWTPSVNVGKKMSDADRSIGRQLPYVPRHTASFTARLQWQSWALLYKWCYYSKRFTMSSNENSISGHLPTYFMSNVALEKGFTWKPADVQLKLAVNNLFNEEYLSVLSRPMPRINFEFFIAVTPHF